MDSPSRLTWPLGRAGEGLHALARACGVSSGSDVATSPAPPGIQSNRQVLEKWVEQASRRLDLEAESVEIPYNAAERYLRYAGPALLTLASADGTSFLVLLEAGRRTAILLAPDGSRHRVRIDDLANWLRRDADAQAGPRIHTLVAEAGLSEPRRRRAGRAILRDHLADSPIALCWLLRLRPDAPFWRHVRHARLVRHAVLFCIAYVVTACVTATAWWIVGAAALAGRLDAGTFVAWTFLLLMLVPLGIVTAWSQGVFAIGAGGVLKLRLLYGALRLDPDETRHAGVGHHLSRVIESESIESLMLAAGFSALATIVDLIIASVIFIVTSQTVHLILLLVTLSVTSTLAWVFFARLQRWTSARLEMTQDLVERMVGHRTRLAQEPAASWHDGEDALLERYLVLSSRMDRANLALMSIPRGWMILALVVFTPSFMVTPASPGVIAATLGAILMSVGALAKLTSTMGYVAGAAIAWKQVKPLLASARQAEDVGGVDSVETAPGARVSQTPFLVARDVSFRYHDRAEPALRQCSVRICHGDRVQLSGRSGGGKSTLVSLLTGLRNTGSGLLLLDGFDRRTLGADGWRRRVVAAPQFHENHIFTESLAFNLLMGRRWPPLPEDIELAEDVCRRLQLGDLIDRMPGGLFQLVGETGWQLSHGERSRVFMARALLQGADLVVFDESFAELDPENLRRCLSEVADMSDTLLVIAHA
jgi:ATP-binding cassette subfamily B protein